MIIKIGDFTLKPSMNSIHYDLVMDGVSVNKETGASKQVERVIGYDMSVPRCLDHIIAYNLKSDDSVVPLEQFLESFKETTERVLSVYNAIH